VDLRNSVLRHSLSRCLFGAVILATLSLPSQSQDVGQGWYRLATIPAVSGYEQELAAEIRSQLKNLPSKTDNLGNVIVTIGSGTPNRLIVTPIDEPGYVVSAITPDGYLRVQRLPQAAPNAVFDLLHAAQPIVITTRKGQKVSGVIAGLSVHLQPARLNAPKMAHPDEMYVDIGAASAEEVHAAGVDLLDPISLNREVRELANSEFTAPAIGDHFGCIALVNLLNSLRSGKAKFSGTLTVAFITQQWAGGRGLDRILNELSPDEMIYVGRLAPPRKIPGSPASSAAERVPSVFKPGVGILLGVSDESAPLSGLAAELKNSADAQHLQLHPELAAPPRIASYAAPTSLPKQFALIGVPILYSTTPAETLSIPDTGEITSLLCQHIVGTLPSFDGGGSGGMVFMGDLGPQPLRTLTETYGASGHELAVRETVSKF
jgi:putative aminopeptidase